MACTESKGYIWYIILELNKKFKLSAMFTSILVYVYLVTWTEKYFDSMEDNHQPITDVFFKHSKFSLIYW